MNPARLARKPPDHLVWLFKQAARSSRRHPGDLLAIACQLLHLATHGQIHSRGCTRVTFEFEGYRSHAVVTWVAVSDRHGDFILALDPLRNWKPDGEQRLGELLEQAAEAYLDGHLPQWRENEGADGHLSIALSPAPDGTLTLAPSGHATVRTMTETPISFPKP
jgi:hypothetical protein